MVLRTQRDANPYAGDATSVFVGLQAELSSRAAIFLRPSGSSLEGSMPRSGPAPDTRSPSSTRAVRAAWPPAPGPQAPGRARRRRLPRFRALVARAAQQRLVFAALMAPPAAMARATAAYAAGGATGGPRRARAGEPSSARLRAGAGAAGRLSWSSNAWPTDLTSPGDYLQSTRGMTCWNGTDGRCSTVHPERVAPHRDPTRRPGTARRAGHPGQLQAEGDPSYW
jgi:hypothetical protein